MKQRITNILLSIIFGGIAVSIEVYHNFSVIECFALPFSVLFFHHYFVKIK